MKNERILEKILDSYKKSEQTGEPASSFYIVYKPLEQKVYINDEKTFITKNYFRDSIEDEVADKILFWARS